MSHTNATPNYALPLFIATDTPAWMADINSAMTAIDTAIDANADNIATNTAALSTVSTKVNDYIPDLGSAGQVLVNNGTGAEWTTPDTQLNASSNNVVSNAAVVAGTAMPSTTGQASSVNIKYLKQSGDTIMPVTKPAAILDDDGNVAVYTKAELDTILPAVGYVDSSHSVTLAANNAINETFSYTIPAGKTVQYVEIIEHGQAAHTMANIASFTNNACTVGVRNFLSSNVTFTLKIRVFYK